MDRTTLSRDFAKAYLANPNDTEVLTKMARAICDPTSLVGEILSTATGYIKIFGHASRGNTFFNTHLPPCDYYYIVYEVTEKGDPIPSEYKYVPEEELWPMHE